MSIKAEAQKIIQNILELGYSHSIQFSDAEHCSFCGEENGSHEDGCIVELCKKSINHKDFFEKHYESILLKIAIGETYNTVAHYIHFEDVCSFCDAENDKEHDEDCLMLKARLVLGDKWTKHLDNEKLKEEKIKKEIEAEKLKIQKQQNRAKNRRIKERKDNEARWAKEAAETGRETCPHCKRPVGNLEEHIKLSVKCKRFRENNGIRL